MGNAERTGLVKRDVVWCEVGGQEKGEEFYETDRKEKEISDGLRRHYPLRWSYGSDCFPVQNRSSGR